MSYNVIKKPTTCSEQIISVLAKLWMAINLASGPFALVYGVENIHECQLERMVPIFLLGQGGVAIFLIITLVCTMMGCNDDNDATNSFRAGMITIAVLVTVLIVWHILGAVWVFRVYPDYLEYVTCNSNAYMCAFVLLVGMMILYALMFLSALCIIKNRFLSEASNA